MPLVVGIDEAGYGPVLGPLVVAATVFEVPDAAVGDESSAPLDGDLWPLLAPGVARERPRRDAAGLWIADSKSIYQGERRLARLETCVLATATLPRPISFHQFIASLTIRPEHVADGEPWHAAEFPSLPLAAEPSAIARGREAFERAQGAGGVRLRQVFVNLAQPWRFNRLVAASDNKATVNWILALELLELLAARFPGQTAHVTMDKHGGRTYYRSCLEESFPLAAVRVLSERPQRSEYLVDSASLSLRLSVREKAERGSLPAALASMYAKYVREIFMAQFNRYWQNRAAGVLPTEGYWQDYGRWSGEMADHLDRLDLPRDKFIRSR